MLNPKGGTMLILWILIIGVLAYFAYSYYKKKQPDSEESPIEILKKRYARGEISREEFESLKRELE